MSGKKTELKQFVENSDFIEKMNKAFLDLRADYELTMDTTNEKILELKKTHVDVKNNLANLISYSKGSSGVVSGLRGTGKTHLLLLARNQLNESFTDNTKNLCIYLNVKRLSIPQGSDELFNRIFSSFIYSEISKQLNDLLERLSAKSTLQKFLVAFDNDKKKLIKSLNQALLKICEFQNIAQSGSQKYEDLDRGNLTKESYAKELLDLTAKISSHLDMTSAEMETSLTAQMLEEVSNTISHNNTYIKYLDVKVVRDQIIELMKLLNINSITFYVDEWEKIFQQENIQKYMASYIDKIIDDPLYFWISIVPHRGGLHCLENGSDLQHLIDLDDNMIYENSKRDREICLNYFKEFINNRLSFYFNSSDSINYNMLFNNENHFEKLVLASMGNTRDFGTMLLKCWSEYQEYRKSVLTQGRPYSYIAEFMIIESIKNNGEKKLSNIKDNENVLKVWHDLERFCISKKSSHFAIEESNENLECLGSKEYSDLIYHRLINLRKSHVSPKETSIENKLTIFALNYTVTYDLHTRDRKITYFTQYSDIDDKARRYMYNPNLVIRNIRISDGDIFPCKSCGASINIEKMKGAWSNNSCPFCGNSIR